ncbi:MAG: hypothetical protein HDS85_02105 [Bacteroidales bacterium]|nr:hypothetical protein [Bacteroidales bacterium]
MNSTPDKNSTPILKESDIEKLKMWIESGSEESHSTDFVGNTSLILLGRKQINLQNSREKVAWNGFFERLINLGFIEIYGYTTKQNKPKYRLKEAAYEFIDSL